jgi:aldose 1-epimerase
MISFKQILLLAILLLGASVSTVRAKTEVSQRSYGKLPNGAEVQLFTLKDEKLEVQVMTYGGYVVSIKTPDRNGKMADVVLGFDEAAGYYANTNSKSGASFGPTIGRYANRIAHAKFSLDGKEFHLTKNDKDNSIHGGPGGFNNVMWQGKVIENGAELSYLSKDGEEGFPGNVTVTVRYTLDGGDLKIEYSARTDKDTVLNLTNHSYFNLTGDATKKTLDQKLTLNASRFTPVDANVIPTGELKSVEKTPFDFRKATSIGDRIDADDPQLKIGHGYDHNFVIDGKAGELTQAAELYDESTGRVLTVFTTEPGVQLYTANFLDGTIHGKKNVAYTKNTAVCLETQHFPDSPNHPKFPSTELKPGQEFHSVTVYRFSAR